MTAPGYLPPADQQPLHAVTDAQAEVQAEQSPRADGAVRVRLGGEEDGIDLWVPPRGMWRSSGLSALNRGDFQAWADVTLTEEDAEAWEAYDPTLDETEEFFGERLRAAMGDDLGKQGRSRRGLRPMRRR